MRVLNVHERELSASQEQAGSLINSLASREDRLWPKHSWPRMQLDRPLGVGATGGHGPVRYFVEAFVPSQSVTFRFTGPRGFDGYHRYDIVHDRDQHFLLRHTLQMTAKGPALVSWPLVFRPLHDALIADSLATAEASLGRPPQVKRWSLWVRVLRNLVGRGRARAQVTPSRSL
ncbi:MAG: SRPBCC family protein [Gemmatimonadaceae bacterium]|nr:SRPBCC family protein [Gemmatimonadaceae bacterium]